MKEIDSNITGHLPKITLDYINNVSSVSEFYNRENKLENYYDQLIEKRKNYNNNFRRPLCEVLKSNYEKISQNSLQITAINNLAKDNTFTVTTGHQLNLFTGPLYFFYKIIDAINSCNELKNKYPENNFVPIYWMASEDHDFKEISFFKTNDNLFKWDISTNGAVGDLETNSLNKTYKEVIEFFGMHNTNSKKIIELFKNSYLNNNKLSDATFRLVHSLFGKHGLLILNPDDVKLKKIICEDIINDVIKNECYKCVTESNKKIKKLNINSQVNPRLINLFYLNNNLRSRIEKENSIYKVLNTNISFSEAQIKKEINNYPERFSPNVLLRPFFQEKILPNLAYVGGGSEIAYWLQLKDFFIKKGLTFPILAVRNSALLVSKKNLKKCKKLDIKISDLLKSKNLLNSFYVKKISEFDIDLTEIKKTINDNFIKLHELSHKTNKSFLGALKAQETKQINGLKNLEKKLIKAQKIQNKDQLDRLNIIKEELFPNNSFQEREINFSEFYRNHGDKFLNILFDNLKPFSSKFLIISL